MIRISDLKESRCEAQGRVGVTMVVQPHVKVFQSDKKSFKG